MKEFQKVYDMLGSKFDSWNGEAFYSDKMEEIVETLEKTGKLIESETEEERRKYIEKYPYAEEVIKIVEEIDRNNIHPHLSNAREIREWIKKSGVTKPPSAYAKVEIKEEIIEMPKKKSEEEIKELTIDDFLDDFKI